MIDDSPFGNLTDIINFRATDVFMELENSRSVSLSREREIKDYTRCECVRASEDNECNPSSGI